MACNKLSTVADCLLLHVQHMLKTVARPPQPGYRKPLHVRHANTLAAAAATTAAAATALLRCRCPLQATALQTFWVWVCALLLLLRLFFFWLVAVSVGVGRCQKGMKLEFIAPSTTTPPAAAAATALTVAVAAAASAAEMLNLNSREKASAPPLLQLSLCWLCTVLQPSLLQPALLLLLSSAAFLNFFSVFFGELLQRLRRLFMHNNFNSFRATINVGQQKKSFGSIHAL